MVNVKGTRLMWDFRLKTSSPSISLVRKVPRNACQNLLFFHLLAPLHFTGERTIIRNSLLATIPHLKQTFNVSLEVNPTFIADGLTNVIHLTTSNQSCCDVGHRVAGVWFRSGNGSTTDIMLCSHAHDNGNHCFTSPYDEPLGRWTSVQISQQRRGRHSR